MKKTIKKKLLFFFLALACFSVGYLSFCGPFLGWFKDSPACFFPRKDAIWKGAGQSQSSRFNRREIASYALYTAEIESRAKNMIESARRWHIIEDYKSANETLTAFLTQYPYTGYIEEASYLLAKGLFFEGEFNSSAQVIKRLREYTRHSHSTWLGYSLLIMGKIHEQRGETDDAIRLYRKIITEFSDTNLVNEAEDTLNNMSF